MTTRQVIRIDEELCNGCGDCVPACEEGALQIVDGKARLVADVYCDGLGACLGECPEGALSIEEREADEFDEEAVRARLARLDGQGGEPLACGCPGSAVQDLRGDPSPEDGDTIEHLPAKLRNWPVQITLVPVAAPWLAGADILVAADCVPFAYRDFHGRFLEGRTLLVGCPKLDDADRYRKKLGHLFAENRPRSVEVVIMEVPCCTGMDVLVRDAVREAGLDIPVVRTVVGVRGEVLRTSTQGVEEEMRSRLA